MEKQVTPSNTTDTIERLLDKMWANYIEMNPQAKRIWDLFWARGEFLRNDHIALRTFDLAEVSINVLATPFVKSGFVAKGEYAFPEKKLRALHFEHPATDMPKIFISEIRVEALSQASQNTIRGLVSSIDPDLPKRFDFCAIGRPWNVSFATYSALRAESDYAAWVAAFGFRPNHFTVDVNSLKRFNSIQAVNEFLKSNGYKLNASGGEVKGSPESLLEQSSVLANNIAVPFCDGPHEIPACYYEFAKRYPLPDGRLYQGFIAASADRIFESTTHGQ